MTARPGPDPAADVDPVLVRRAAVLAWCDRGQRTGYACFGLALVVFVVAFALQFPAWTVTAILVLMGVGSAVFLPAVIFGYAAKAADKEERGEKFGY